MKAYTSVVAILFFITIFFGSIQISAAQDKKQAKEIITQKLIANQQYVFCAQNVTPMSGRQRFLTSEYTVNIVKDTIQCDLPYFGRAYSAPMSTSDNGIKFTSTNFNYTIDSTKKGKYKVTIKPKDAQDVQVMNFTIFSNGTASLNVSCTNRQAISFNGYIEARKQKKLSN